MKQEIAFLPPSFSPVAAIRTVPSLILVPALLMKILLPLTIQSPLTSRTALVRSPPASDPAPASVSAKAPSLAPLEVPDHSLQFDLLGCQLKVHFACSAVC